MTANTSGVQSGDETSFIFEAFETSPSAEQTLAAKGALQWDFPGVAVSVPAVVFEDRVFQESLAAFIEKASVEYLDLFVTKVRKAGVEVSEIRDTSDPSIITQFLITLLEVNGERLCLPVLRKRVNDDVCWDSAKTPWRRSPFWLVLRVCVQRLLYLHLGSAAGRIQYKALMCLFLANLLNDSVSELNSEKYHLLKVKLCRRLAKLDSEKGCLSGTHQAAQAYKHVLGVIEPHCTKSIDLATADEEREWKAWKQDFQRRVPRLPPSASPGDTKLTLPSSIGYFRGILKPRQLEPAPAKGIDPNNLRGIAVKSTSKQFADLIETYSSLAAREAVIGSMPSEIPSTIEGCKTECIELANRISDYISTVGDKYDGNSEQMSMFIMNVFTMWEKMDRCALEAYPLLKDYHPWFEPEILDVLLLERWKHMKRVNTIQSHIHTRCIQAKRGKTTIFANPAPGCFAEMYFETADALNLQALQLRILMDSENSNEKKKSELRSINDQFDSLTEKLRLTSCTLLRNEDGTHDIRGCNHCYYMRSRRRLEVHVHEDFLPVGHERLAQQKAVVFELRTPRAFSAYRQATWDIINALCPMPDSSSADRPEVLLAQYSQLKSYYRIPVSASFCLASHTKSFLGTHYSHRRLPASATDVLLPHGLRYSYYDSERHLWFSDYPMQLTLVHHFAFSIPKEFPFSALYSSSLFAADGDGPSSYEVVASIGQCPSELTVHEYMAHQGLMGGRNRRWLSILAELGSSNINFSLQDTMVLFNHLALQAGPRLEHDSMRAVHAMFRDRAFCKRLSEQICRHVESIATNWRETSYMETLLTMSLRLFLIGHLESRIDSKKLVLRIRQITLNWVTLLRSETRQAEDITQSDRAARYCFLSALLCRRTFFPWLTSQTALDLESMKCFFEASLAMQESLVVDLSKFSTITRNMLIRDIKMVARMSVLLRTGVMKYPMSIGAAIDAAWPGVDGKERTYNSWRLLLAPHEDWAMSTTIPSEGSRSQTLYFHILEGHFVVDGKTIGKLPADIRDSHILKELFGNQRLFALPSNLPGMDHVLLNRADEHQIHLGYRAGNLVIQARAFRTVLELVPREVFGDGPAFDLPYSLISDCIHWADLSTGRVEIRPKPRIWKRRDGNWSIDIRARKALRTNAQRDTLSLIDPFSQLAQMISQIFLHFEHPARLTIQQSSNGITVDLKRMDLTFFVTRGGQLKCQQLGAIVDRNQDPGTFYGLQSMLVLKDINDWSQRSIIIPLGKARYRRHRSHVLLEIEHTGNYMRYTINTVLQRLECPADPQLLYSKAYLHALTSHLLPDPLTGRTGTQEALACLQSGYCQPWQPLRPDPISILVSIAKLTPHRTYYPKDKRCQQIVSWDSHLTANIQHEGFQVAVEVIIKKSQRLSQFNGDVPNFILPETPKNTVHLCERAQWRRSLFESSDTLSEKPVQPKDTPYVSRDGWAAPEKVRNLREIVTLLRKQPASIHTTRDIVGLLEKWELIGGYMSTSTLHDIGNYLNADLAGEWGGLINLCRESKTEEVYGLMFQLGLIAFGERVDMTALRIIVSFFIIRELKVLELPQYPSFVGFREGELPTTDNLLPIIRISYQPQRPSKISKKRKGSVPNENRRFGYDVNCEKEGVALAELLALQWPCPEPSVEGFEPNTVDLHEAMKALLPEWQRMYRNAQLQRHLVRVQTILNHRYAVANDVLALPAYLNRSQKDILGTRPKPHFFYPRLGEDLVGKEALGFAKYSGTLGEHIITPNAGALPVPSDSKTETPQSPTREIVELERLVSRFGQSDCSVRNRYSHNLQQSIAALKSVKQELDHGHTPQLNTTKERIKLDGDVKASRERVDMYHHLIVKSLSAHDTSFRWLSKGGLWPRLTPTTLLQQLRSISLHDLGPGMSQMFISYALAITELQKFLRLREATVKRDETKLHQERIDPGHVNWDPSDFPDWVLLEIDANIRIRQDQITVAFEMISPTSGSNSVLQMNMGQGKTSVIMPMVAAVLANGQMLNRLLVPKALLTQAALILQSRLGGLLGRELIHIPFSRRTQTPVSLIKDYRGLHSDMLETAGVILGIPEHILSFKLSGLQRLADSKLTEAVQMVETQKWLDEVSRDVLDECDFTLAVKTQLIYPGGSQHILDGHPDRWEVAMTVLGLVGHHLNDLAREYPKSIDILERNSTGFPVTHLLRRDVEEALVRKIAQDICEKRTSLLPLGECNEKAKDAIRVFITQEKVEKSITKRITKLFPDTPKARKIVYLLRGLLVHGILILCLKKRWNVQYGLHHGRDPIAVPFHAKGVPSDQAEWGHPDVALLFTCLAFYYEGLSQQQLKISLESVLKSDHPATEYDKWIQNSNTLPEGLRHWNAITVDDAGLVAEIWRHLRFTPVVINHFLGNFVFPLHAKQFATKLQASGWDVLLNAQNNDAEWIHPGVTTGFSGTNDNRALLPLTIEQFDLPGLSHTNAEVLTYLLQTRNRRYRVATNVNGKRLAEIELLDYLHKQNIRVLIDAGAFIMEMNNMAVARAWIQTDFSAKGAVYFDEDNKPWVMYRNFKRVPLFASPFADDMRGCVVYIDESHTRGTDLKLPPEAVGALTLGLGQTKDHTVQGELLYRVQIASHVIVCS